MDIKEIENNTIFLFTRGSQAYGTNNAESDEDIGGVCLPSKECLYGFEQFEQKDNWVDENGEKIDKVIYTFNKAIDLLIKNNPNMLDFINAPERTIKFIRPEWEKFVEIRDEFLCRKAKWSFQGYAVDQLNRIKTHRSYLLNPPKAKPERKDFGLPEETVFPITQREAIAKLSSEYVPKENRDAFFTEMTTIFDRECALIFKKHIPREYHAFAIAEFKKDQRDFLNMISSISGKFLKDEYRDMAENELRYMSAAYNWKKYTKWKNGRNEHRAKMEEKCGYDSKHAMHNIRLLTMAVEIMEGKGVLVDRTNIDRDYLMAIRNGEFKYEEVIAKCDELNAKADELYKTCTLPERPNVELINKVREQVLDKHLDTLLSTIY